MKCAYRNQNLQKKSPFELINFCSLHTQQQYFKMKKSRVIEGDVDETVHSELSHGGYATSDEKAEMPNYLVQLQSQNDVIVDIDMEEEPNQRVNGGDQDNVGDNARDFEDTMREVEQERSHVLLGYDSTEKAGEGGTKYGLLRDGDTMEPYEVKVPK